MGSKENSGFTGGKRGLPSNDAFGDSGDAPAKHSVGDIESFITMLQTACAEPKVNATLERILSLPDDQRRAFIHNWVSDMLIEKAPMDFIRAIACLSDDQVAEKTYEVIFQCKRKF
jgi:hypothetical protein